MQHKAYQDKKQYIYRARTLKMKYFVHLSFIGA